MKQPFLNRLATAIALLLFLLAYGPLLLLSVHNHPSAADDYCFADTAVRYGFWQAQQYYYDGWTGRYFSNMLVHGNPLVWGWYDGFRLIPALAATGLLAACYALISTLLDGHSLRIRFMTTGLLFFTLIAALPGTVEAFFWTAAVASYTVPTILTIYLLAVLLRWYRLPPGQLRNLTSLWACVLVFAIVGSSETNLILLGLVLGAVMGCRILFERRFDPFLAFLLGVALVSTWIVFRAPGNAVRLGANQDEGNVLASLMTTLYALATSGLRWLWQTPILPLSVFWLPLAAQLNRPGSPTQLLFKLPPLLAGAGVVALLIVLVFPSVYGLGFAPPRVMNLAYVVFVFGWFYTLTVGVGWLLGRSKVAVNELVGIAWTKGWMTVLAAVWVIGAAWFSPTFRQLYRDLLSGQAATYDRDMTLRHQQLLQPADTLRLRPIRVHPASLFIDDIKPDRQHWWNRCQSGYYGHRVIVLDTSVSVAMAMPTGPAAVVNPTATVTAKP